MGRQLGLPTRVAKLLKQQARRWAYCGLYFGAENRPKIDHIIPKSQGGRDAYHNWQLLHAYCHHHQSTQEKLRVRRGTDVNGQACEEPDEVNVSSTVLNQPWGEGVPIYGLPVGQLLAGQR